VDHVLVGLGVTGSVVDIPSKSLETWVYELAPNLRFVVGLLLEGSPVLDVALHELENTLWRWGGVSCGSSGHGTIITLMGGLGKEGRAAAGAAEERRARLSHVASNPASAPAASQRDFGEERFRIFSVRRAAER